MSGLRRLIPQTFSDSGFSNYLTLL